MLFTQVDLFKYSFFFTDGSQETKVTPFNIVKEWCNENLNGQWIVFDNDDQWSTRTDVLNINIYSKALHKSPVHNTLYPPATITIQPRYVISFELEEDAVAFKLRWDQINVS